MRGRAEARRSLGEEEQRDDEAVEAEHFGEDQDENHADEQTRLLRGAADARVADDADREARRQSRQAHTQAGAQLPEVPARERNEITRHLTQYEYMYSYCHKAIIPKGETNNQAKSSALRYGNRE